MNTTHDRAFFISGLCFQPEIIRASVETLGTIELLHYLHNIELTLPALTVQLAQQLPDHATIIAWSFGGLLATQLAVQYPQKVKALVFMNYQPRLLQDKEWPGLEPTRAKQLLQQATHHLNDFYADFIARVNYPNLKRDTRHHLKQHRVILERHKLLTLLALLLMTDLREAYARIRQPILHLISSHDAVMTQTPHTLAKLNAHANIHTIHRAGHAGFITHASLYQHLIRDFMYHGSH